MRWRDLVQHNLGLKLFSLGLATLTWFTLRYMARDAAWAQAGGPPSNTIEFSGLRLSTLTAVDDARTYRVQPEEVTVRVSGRAADLKRLAAQDILVFVNLTGIREARDLVREIKAQGPAGIVIQRVRPPLAIVNTVSTNASDVAHDPP